MKKFLLIFIPFSLSLAAQDLKISPSFPCKNAISNLEKEICKSHITSSYDAVLGYLYKNLLKLLPQEKREKLKESQKEWLKSKREEGFKEDIKIIKENTFPKKDYPQGWVRRLDLAYAKRINQLIFENKEILQEFLFKELATYQKETVVPLPLKFAFFWYIYVHFDPAYDPDDVYNTHAFAIDHESQFKKLKNDKWLIAHRGNALLAMTNKDGGIYCFFLFNPTTKKLTLLKIEDDLNVENNKEHQLNLEENIQAYFM